MPKPKEINNLKKKTQMKLFFTLLIVAIAAIILSTSKTFTNLISFKFHQNDFINSIAKHQLLAILVATIVVVLITKLNPDNKHFLNIGNLNVIAEKEKWLGINGKSTWKTNGLQLLFFVSIPTAIFMFLALKYTNSLNNFQLYFIPLIILFALINSLTEELIFRFGIVGGLYTHSPKLMILIISAILFGLPHYFGWPSGFAGIFMAGMLGYILCKATIETKGISIAWTIHFVQDVIIFTALFMMNIKK